MQPFRHPHASARGNRPRTAARAFSALVASVLAASLLVLGAALPGVANAADAVPYTIGYLEDKSDRRYTKKRVYARFLMQPLGRPYTGAKVAVEELRFQGLALGVEFGLKRKRRKGAEGLLKAIDDLSGEGIDIFIIDAPAPVVSEVAAATRDRDLLLLNVSARDDVLRQAQCQPHLFHVIPSYAMSMDALVQYLSAQKWRKALVLEGPEPEDEKLAKAFARAAGRYGVKITETRDFVLSNDPRKRDRNNVALLTGGKHDIVFVADTDGEFARDVPYQTLTPSPVVGTEGLAGLAWHWSWERNGAPQLEGRFEEKAGRPMAGVDWAAWMAVKAVGEAMLRAESTDIAPIREKLLDPDIVIDGFKGNRMNFRPWSRQLRQPMLIATHNWVVERAPIEGFLHRVNTLDTLGYDEPESECPIDG